MKNSIVVFVFILTAVLLNATAIPYSTSELKSDSNHLSQFLRIAPDDSLAVPLQTNVWLWHDSENLYVLLNAEIDENFEQGRLGVPDEWVDCDFFRIQIITDIKNYYAYMFSSFPMGNHYDGIRTSGMNMETEWNSNYQTENIITDDLWISKMTIPFKDLRYNGNAPHQWKIILTRYFEKDDEFYSCPYGTISMGKDYFRTAMDITINEDIAKNKNYRITPYFIKKYDLMTETESFDPDNVGLDFSYNPTTSTKMKVSLNPDFSDVPMDCAEDNFNIRYAPSFYENRYFFIEDLDVFGVAQHLFYSRHIVQPSYAVKFTGNAENFSYGFLSAKDKDTFGEDDFYNMAAFKPKWENLSIQMTLLNRMNEDYHNEVLYINPVWEFINNHTLWGEIDLSWQDTSDDPDKKGYAVYSGYSGEEGDLSWNVTASKMSKDFCADMGQIYETGISNYSAYFGQNSDPDGKIISDFGYAIWGGETYDDEADRIDHHDIGGNIWLNSPHDLSFSINVNVGEDCYNDTLHYWDNVFISLRHWSISWFRPSIAYSNSHSLVYSLAETFDNDTLNLNLSGDISHNLTYSFTSTRKRYFKFPANCSIDNEYWISNADLTFNFSNKLSITNGLRHNNYETSCTTAYVGFFSNLRYEYKDNCNLYIGYKTAQDEIDENYVPNYRQAYFKVTYTL